MIHRLLAIALLGGCGFNESPHHCNSTRDCPNGRQCVYAIDDGCSGSGHCDDQRVSRFGPQMPCKSGVACGCDGGPGFPIGCGWDTPVVSDKPCP